jgi:two-component system sensor histidine kinase KdpD
VTSKTSVAPDLPLLSVDPVLFEQVLVNLVENAIKHTPSGSPIEIGARLLHRASPSRSRIEVQGIPAGSEEASSSRSSAEEPSARSGGVGARHLPGHRRSPPRDDHGPSAGGGAVFTVLLPSRDDMPAAGPEAGEEST